MNEQAELRPGVARTNARNDGREFQRQLEVIAGSYHTRGLAYLQKVDPPVAVVWIPDKRTGEKKQRVIFKQNPFLDYLGVWTVHHGRMILMEAKSTSGHRLPAFGEAGFKDKQWAAMKRWRFTGAACCLLWSYAGQVRLWTPELLMVAEAAGAKSLEFQAGIPVEQGDGLLRWDWLRTLEKKLWP